MTLNAHTAKPKASASAKPKAKSKRQGKAATAADCQALQQIPNIGSAMVADFALLGIHRPEELVGADALALYQRLCQTTHQRHDPCVLDTFMAAVDFMNGGPARDWWSFTAQRKLLYPDV